MCDRRTSDIADAELLCDGCVHRTDTTRLEKTSEEGTENAEIEYFECPNCGATGTVKRKRETGLVTRHGAVTTPRLIDLKRASAWERSHGGAY